MFIVVPEPKRIANLAKHGIDMNDFEGGFSWEWYVILPAKRSRTGRARERFVGMLNGALVSTVVSPLGSEALSVVSIRPASDGERAVYDAQG